MIIKIKLRDDDKRVAPTMWTDVTYESRDTPRIQRWGRKLVEALNCCGDTKTEGGAK